MEITDGLFHIYDFYMGTPSSTNHGIGSAALRGRVYLSLRALGRFTATAQNLTH